MVLLRLVRWATLGVSSFLPIFGNGPNTVSASTVSNTELSEFFSAHWVPGSELSEFLSAYYLCAKANSPSFWQNSPSLPQNSVSSLFQNSTLETVFRPFPKYAESWLNTLDSQEALSSSRALACHRTPPTKKGVGFHVSRFLLLGALKGTEL